MRRYLVLLLASAVVACSPSGGTNATSSTSSTVHVATSTSQPVEPVTTSTTMAATTTTLLVDFGVSSPAFEDGAVIPQLHSCDGADQSPGLHIVGLPFATASVAIVMNDPDAPLGPWDHWVVFDIPARAGELDIASGETSLGVDGINSWKVTGYMGPCPPAGEEHTYVVSIYALDGLLGLPAGVDSATLFSAMDGHVIGSVELTGIYGR